MNRSLRDAQAIITAAGLTIDGVAHTRRHVRITCRDAASGQSGTLTIHQGNILNSRFSASLRSAARAIKRGQYAHSGASS